MTKMVDDIPQGLQQFATGGIVKGPPLTITEGLGLGCIPQGNEIWNLPGMNLTPTITRTTADDIVEICDGIRDMLLEKNRKYGDSALNPTRVFSKADSIEQIKVRIDDKLSRLRNAQNDEDEDVIHDLMGYLVLLRIAQNRQKKAQKVAASGASFTASGITALN